MQIDPSLVTFSNHFKAQFRAKGFKAEQIHEALTHPYKVTDVTRYPGQKRYCGGGVAVVMRDNVAVTVYADGVVTPMREDQKNDPAAQKSVRLNRRK
jgi:hypothetical protein